MFKKASSIPQRTPFSLTSEQIIEDIEAIYKNEDQRNKLYFCIDEKPPQEHKFDKIEEFLKGTHDLERSSEQLANFLTEAEALKAEIKKSVLNIKTTIESVQKQN